MVELAQQYGVTALGQQSRITTERLKQLSQLVDSGAVTVHVEKTFSLAQTAEALDYLKNTPPKGKVVIDLSSHLS